MKLLTSAAKRQLDQDLAELKAFREQEKSDKDKSEVKRLQKRVEEVQKAWTENVQEINQEHEDEVEELELNHERAIRALEKSNEANTNKLTDEADEARIKLARTEAQLKNAKTELGSIEQREKNLKEETKDLDIIAADLDHREVLITGREKRIGKIEDAVADVRAEAKERSEDVRKEGYGTGYADGVADGLRKCNELQSDDRELIGRLATISIAQKNEGLQDELNAVVKQNLTNILSPAQKGSKKSEK